MCLLMCMGVHKFTCFCPVCICKDEFDKQMKITVRIKVLLLGWSFVGECQKEPGLWSTGEANSTPSVRFSVPQNHSQRPYTTLLFCLTVVRAVLWGIALDHFANKYKTQSLSSQGRQPLSGGLSGLWIWNRVGVTVRDGLLQSSAVGLYWGPAALS